MKQKKLLSSLMVSALTFSMLFGYGNVATFAASDSANAKTETSTEETQKTEEENQADAEQLLKDLTGSYQELWTVILDDQYKQLWLDLSLIHI